MTSILRATVLFAVFGPQVAAQDEPTSAEDRAAAAALRRAVDVQLEPVFAVDWGEADAPSLFQSPIGPLLNAVVFSQSGRYLAVQSHFDAWVLDLETANWTTLDLVTMEGTVEGPAAKGGFLVAAAGGCYRAGPGLHEPELLAEDLPDRADGFPAPGGQQLVMSGLTKSRQVIVQLVDLRSGERTRLAAPEHSANATAVAWSPDGARLAVAWELLTSARRSVLGVRLYDRQGELVRAWPGDGDAVVRAMEFAFDAKSLTVAGSRVRRLDLASGDVLVEADAAPVLLWGNVDPVVAISVQRDGITLWDAARLRPGRTVPVDEEPIEVRGRPKGPVLGAALSEQRGLLVLGTVRGLRVYRIRP